MATRQTQINLFNLADVELSYTRPDGKRVTMKLDGPLEGGLTQTVHINEDHGRFYPFGEDVDLYVVNPPTVESVGWHLDAKGVGMSLRFDGA